MISHVFRVTILFILLTVDLIAQANYRVDVYTPEQYENFRQNWAVSQDDKGLIYVGNSSGLILYDGAVWKSMHVEVGGIVRSLAPFQNKIYWGGLRDLGYIASDSLHQSVPISIRHQAEKYDRDFSSIWHIQEYNNELYITTNEALFIIKDDSLRVTEFDGDLLGAFSTSQGVILNVVGESLALYDGNSQAEIVGSDAYGDDTLFAVLPLDDGSLLISRNQGLMHYNGTELQPFPSEISDYLNDHLPYRAVNINDSEMAIATLTGGVVIINKEGDLQKIITEDAGLPTNIIYDLFLDREETLWAATDNGLAKLFVNNPVTVLNEDVGFIGNTLFLEKVEGSIFIGSTEGLFIYEESGRVWEHPLISGRVFDAFQADNALYVTTIDGIFRVTQDSSEQVSTENINRFAATAATGGIYYGSGRHKIFQISLNGISIETSELLELDTVIHDIHYDGTSLWIAGLDRMVYKKSLSSEEVVQYSVPVSEQSSLIQGKQIKGRYHLGTSEGLFVFNESESMFQKATNFDDPEVTSTQLSRFQQCSENEVWLRNNRLIKRAIYNPDENVWNVTSNPYRTIGRNESVTAILCGEDSDVWFGGTPTIYHLSDPEWEYRHDFSTNITGLYVDGDSLIYGGYGDPTETMRLSYEDNNLRFTYAAASYILPEENSYRVRLSGLNDDWSEWTNETRKDYTFIREGTYTFEVQGRNVYRKEGSIAAFTFTIQPPWYRTIWAYLVYLLLISGIIYGGFRIRLNTILREQRIRDGIARDLHDELSSTLSSINFFAEAINSEKLDRNKSGRFLTLIQRSSSEAKEKISDIVWVIHSDNDDWQNLLLRCKRFAADLLDARGIKHTFEKTGAFRGKPTIKQRKNIWLIFREILTNIARHADPQLVNIHFSMHSGYLTIHIEDNGKGFNPAEINQDGYGIQNIKERANQLNGSYTLQAKPGEGTRWVVELPLG